MVISLCRLASVHMHVQSVLCMDGCSGGHPNLMTRDCFEGKMLHDYSQGHYSLHQCKLVSDALPRTPTKWNVPACGSGEDFMVQLLEEADLDILI